MSLHNGFGGGGGGAKIGTTTGKIITYTGKAITALNAGDRVRCMDTLTRLPDPAVLPAGNRVSSAFSQDGTYFVVGSASSPWITIYKRSGDTFTKLANPATLPGGSAMGVAFTPDAEHLVVGHATSPYFSIYKRSGDTFTKLANPATLPLSYAQCLAISSDGVYVVLSIPGNTERIVAYKRSGDTFTKISFPATTFTAYGLAFSPDGVYLAVSGIGTGNKEVYKRTGDTFTKLTIPAVPSIPTSTHACAFSPDGRTLAFTRNDGTYNASLELYRKSGDTFTFLERASVSYQISTGYCVDFSTDEKNIASGFSSSTAGVLSVLYGEKYLDTVYVTNGTVNTVRFSPDGECVFYGGDGVFYMYQKTRTVESIYPVSQTYQLTRSYGIGVTKADAQINSQVAVDVSFQL